MRDWIAVSDKEPEYDTDVLLSSSLWGRVYVGYWAHWHEWVGRYNPEFDKELPNTNPTHWMPFPEPVR